MGGRVVERKPDDPPESVRPVLGGRVLGQCVSVAVNVLHTGWRGQQVARAVRQVNSPIVVVILYPRAVNSDVDAGDRERRIRKISHKRRVVLPQFVRGTIRHVQRDALNIEGLAGARITVGADRMSVSVVNLIPVVEINVWRIQTGRPTRDRALGKLWLGLGYMFHKA